MYYIIAAVFFLAVVFGIVLLVLLRKGKISMQDLLGDSAVVYPYELRRVFSNAEQSFYQVLCNVVPDNNYIMTKVRLADIVKVKKGTDNYQSHFNQIRSKHIDYVVLDDKFAIIYCIELDDKSHSRSDRIDRDKFIDGLFASVNLPLKRVKVQRIYDVKELSEYLNG